MNTSLYVTTHLAPSTSRTSNDDDRNTAFEQDGWGGVISEDAMYYFRVVNWAIICQGICIFGVISNIVNMIVFVKTGFKDSINMSLFALAISDFGSCFTLIFSTIAMNPWFQNTVDAPVAWDEVQYLASLLPHIPFTKTTTLITAFITFERCLCVSLPLKVKAIVTRQRVVTYLVTVYVVVFALMAPLYYVSRLEYKFYPGLNATLLGIVFTEERQIVETVIYPILNLFMSMFGFVFIIISTIVLVVELDKKSKWRLKATTTINSAKTDSTTNEASTKEHKISKMVVAISSLFIVCFLPSASMQLIMWVDRRVSVEGEYENLAFVLSYFAFTFESVNSAMNIGIYYRNSSNYKAVFDRLFARGPITRTKDMPLKRESQAAK